MRAESGTRCRSRFSAFIGGISLGFATALARLYGNVAAKSAARFYVWVIRGTPLLVQLFIIFYGLPMMGLVLDPFPAVLIGFYAVGRGVFVGDDEGGDFLCP